LNELSFIIHRSVFMIYQSTDYITHFDTCCMVWKDNYMWSKALNLNLDKTNTLLKSHLSKRKCWIHCNSLPSWNIAIYPPIVWSRVIKYLKENDKFCGNLFNVTHVLNIFKFLQYILQFPLGWKSTIIFVHFLIYLFFFSYFCML
jgi:hypothetical protein